MHLDILICFFQTKYWFISWSRTLLLDVYIKENETKVNEVYIKLEDNMLLVDACHAQT